MFSTPSNTGMVKAKGEHAESIGSVRSTTTAGNTVTVSVAVSVQPNACVTVRLTSNVVSKPSVTNSSAAFSVAAEEPLPKSQLNDCAALVSLRKLTFKGSQPALMSAAKLAVGDGFTCNKATAIPPQPYCVSASNVMMDAEVLSVLFSQVWFGPFSVEVVPSPKFQSKL